MKKSETRDVKISQNPEARRDDDIKFLDAYLQKLRRDYVALPDLLPSDYNFELSEAERIRYEAGPERVARLADEVGIDGTVFRDYLLETPESSCDVEAMRRLRAQIETVPRIVVKLEEIDAVASGASSPSKAKLLAVPEVAQMLNCGESTVRDRNRKGLIPRPIELGGSLRWSLDDLTVWINHGCPARAEWERNRDKWMKEVNDVTT